MSRGGDTEPKVAVNRLYGIFDDEKSKHQAGSVYDKNGLAPTLDTMQGGYRQPCIEIKNNTKKGYLDTYEDDSVYTNTSNKRGIVQPQRIQTITTRQDLGVVVKKNKYDLIDWLENEKKYCRDIGFECCVEELEKVIEKVYSYDN